MMLTRTIQTAPTTTAAGRSSWSFESPDDDLNSAQMPDTLNLDDSPLGVIVPVFNEAATLPETLHRLLLQLRVLQVLVVDERTADEFDGIADAFAYQDSRLVVHRLPANRGKGAAVLAGL